MAGRLKGPKHEMQYSSPSFFTQYKRVWVDDLAAKNKILIFMIGSDIHDFKANKFSKIRGDNRE